MGQPPDDFQPSRWWRVLDQDGRLWCETSDEREARRNMRAGDSLWRLYIDHREQWREVQD